MNTFNRSVLAGFLTLALGSTAVAADDDIREMQALSAGLGLISLDEAQSSALAAKPGFIKDADLERRKLGRGWEYEFEILDAKGNEWDVYVSATTGEVRKVEKDWF